MGQLAFQAFVFMPIDGCCASLSMKGDFSQWVVGISETHNCQIAENKFL